MPLIIESNDLFSRLKMIDRLRRFPVTKLLFSLLLLVRSWFASGEKVPGGSHRKWCWGAWNEISRMLLLSKRIAIH